MNKLIGILAILIAMSSCKMGKNFESIEVQSDSLYRFSNDSLIQASEQVATLDSNGLRWWELFDDPILDSIVVVGLQNNQDAQIALKSIEQAATQYKIQRADMLPKFDASAGINRGNYQGFLTDGGNTSMYATGVMNWEIDFWGKYRRLNESAKADLLASQYGFQAVQIRLITQIVTSYYELLAQKANYKIALKTLSVRDSSLVIIEARFRLGIIPEIDLNQAQIQKAIAQSAVPFYKRRLILAENTLSLLLGGTPQSFDNVSTLVDQNPVPEIPVGLPSQLLSRRPDILQAEQNAVAQNAKIGAAIAARYPSISLTGVLGIASSELTGLNAGSLAWNAGAGLVAPLFYFGQNKRRVTQERILSEQANLNYEKTVLTAFKEVEDALIEIETYKSEIEARKLHVEAATKAQDLSRLRYDKGVTSYLEYLEQQRQAFEAELQYVDAQKNLYHSYIELYKALGGGWDVNPN